MTDDFLIPVVVNGKEREYRARLIPQGYSYKICVSINDTDVYFEPDEERNFRAVRMPGQDEKQLDKIGTGLLQAIKEKIEEVLA